mgnify:FL=1
MKSAAIKNAGVTFFTQLINLALKFVLQKIFIDNLGVAYLGYNSVFTNILQMLNLADLGIGIAITGFLYKPIANNDEVLINALMSLYRKVYIIMGIVVALIGSIVLLLLPFIIPDADCSDLYLRILFFINLIGTVSTYFMAYNRTLLVAQEKSYFVNFIDTCSNFIFTVLQVICLVFIPNYVLFLILNVVKNLFANLIITVECNKKNIYLKNAVDSQLYQQYKIDIIKHVKNIFASKIGAYIYYGTDNIIISIFQGSLMAGYLANYTLITTALQGIISSIFSAIQASFGSILVTTEDCKKQMQTSDMYMCINYIIANVCLVCCLFIFQPFIKIYIGKKYLLNMSTVFLLSTNLFLSVMLLVPSQIFVIFKLFTYDKRIVMCSALLNIVISVALVRVIGIDGVLIGTLITSVIYLVSRLYICSKIVFKVSFFRYIKLMISWFVKSGITIFIVYIISKFMSPGNWIELIGYAILLCIISLIVPILLSCKNKDVQSIVRIIYDRS